MDVPKIVFQDRIRQRTFEQFADSPALWVVEEQVFKVFSQDRVQQHCVEQMPEVPEISSKDQIQTRTTDQILDDPVPQMMEQLGEVPKMVSESINEQPSQSSRFSPRTGFNSVLLGRTHRTCRTSERICEQWDYRSVQDFKPRSKFAAHSGADAL